MQVTRKGSSVWKGGKKDGKGEISTESGALKDYPYCFSSRFEGQKGSNPEELVGAAHASCFNMALALMLTEDNLQVESLETTAKVTLKEDKGGYSISSSHLQLKAKIPDVDKERFLTIATKAKENCPISKLLNTDIQLDAELL